LATGNYGIVRPSDVSPEDVDIILHYTPSRDETDNFTLTKLDSLQYLRPYFSNDTIGGGVNELLGGLYNLTLPAGEFTALGIYTLYFRPRIIRTVINDCGVLTSSPNTKGIIINIQEVPAEDRNKFVNQGLVGYRVEYLNDDGTKIPNFYRLVTSNFYCEPVTLNLTNTQQKNIRYRYATGTSNLIFLTLTPSSAPTNKPNATPFIGVPAQNILITNTFFNPTVVEVEIVEHDASTLAIALYGNQTKSMEDGIYTIYDTENNIYRQYNLYEIRDQYNELLYEVRQDRGNNIDFSKNFENIISENA
jgi:hypothetical protein